MPGKRMIVDVDENATDVLRSSMNGVSSSELLGSSKCIESEWDEHEGVFGGFELKDAAFFSPETQSDCEQIGGY
jgi:hypothetical protein